MALPASYQSVRVRARYVDLAGDPVSGRVTFTAAPVALVAPADLTIVMGKPLVVDLDKDGRLDIVLPATDDPDVDPTGFTYLVEERFAGAGIKGRTYSIKVPLSARPEGIDLSTASPAIPIPGVTRPQTLDELADVIVAQPLQEEAVLRVGPDGVWGPHILTLDDLNAVEAGNSAERLTIGPLPPPNPRLGDKWTDTTVTGVGSVVQVPGDGSGGSGSPAVIYTSQLGVSGLLDVDDTPNVQAAVEILRALGGGQLIADVPTLLDGQSFSGGVQWAVFVGSDDIEIRCVGRGKWVRTRNSGCGFLVSGSGKNYPAADWRIRRYMDSPVYPIVLPVLKGATQVQLQNPGDRVNFAPGAKLHIRTGQVATVMVTPNSWPSQDSQTIEVLDVSEGGLIRLRGAVGKTIRQEYYPYQQVAKKRILNGVATLTFTGSNGTGLNMEVLVEGVGAPFDGLRTVTAATRSGPGSLSFAVPGAADVAETASGGTTIGYGGLTTTTVTPRPAAVGVSNVSDRTIKNFRAVQNVVESASTDRNFFSIWQVDGVDLLRNKARCAAGLFTGRDRSHVRVLDNDFIGYGTADSMDYWNAFASGDSDVWSERNTVHSEVARFEHVYEGVVSSRIRGNRYYFAAPAADSCFVAYRARTYDAHVEDVKGGSTGYIVFVDASCDDVGVIDDIGATGPILTTPVSIPPALTGWRVRGWSSRSGPGLLSIAAGGGAAGPLQHDPIGGWFSAARPIASIGETVARSLIESISIYIETPFNGGVFNLGITGDQARYVAGLQLAGLAKGWHHNLPAGAPADPALSSIEVPSAQVMRVFITGGPSAGRGFVVVRYLLNPPKV